VNLWRKVVRSTPPQNTATTQNSAKGIAWQNAIVIPACNSPDRVSQNTSLKTGPKRPALANHWISIVVRKGRDTDRMSLGHPGRMAYEGEEYRSRVSKHIRYPWSNVLVWLVLTDRVQGWTLVVDVRRWRNQG
jgi:hypothetical protein